MKLGAIFFAISALAMTGCASSCPAPAQTASSAPVVSTTRLTAADLAETELPPLVGKAQQHVTISKEDAPPPKDGSRHEGGGFSGYK
jgi:hypothetical protein